MTFDECLEEIKRESPEARKCIEIAEGIADIMYKEDYVKVVRCKDCKYNLANIENIQDGININEDWNACYLTELYDSVKPTDFCSYGERKTESLLDEIKLLSPLRKKKYKAVKYGTWTEVSGCGNWICSNCSNSVISSKPYSYCPNCGADMRGK